MYKVKSLNAISSKGLDRFPHNKYEVASEVTHPDALLLRSYNMHEMEIPNSLCVVGRAGAGVNNIPVSKLTQMGIPVLNSPGANANAVKELVVAGMLLACRNICQAWDFAHRLEGDNEKLNTLVEKEKNKFAGFELLGRTLGVIGLGAIGVKVANAAIALGMRVIGYDPTLTVKRAWELSAHVEQANTVDDLVSRSDFITVHVPLSAETKNLINAQRIAIMKSNAVVLNFAREGVVEDAAILEGLNQQKLYAYVSDFPTSAVLKHPRVIALPHLGASTEQAEENCAVMVVDQIREYLEFGIIRNSVNFPEAVLPRTDGTRLAIANQNIPNMVGQISTTLAEAGLNIVDMLNKSRGEIAYTLVDMNQPIPEITLQKIRAISGILRVRVVYG